MHAVFGKIDLEVFSDFGPISDQARMITKAFPLQDGSIIQGDLLTGTVFMASGRAAGIGDGISLIDHQSGKGIVSHQGVVLVGFSGLKFAHRTIGTHAMNQYEELSIPVLVGLGKK